MESAPKKGSKTEPLSSSGSFNPSWMMIRSRKWILTKIFLRILNSLPTKFISVMCVWTPEDYGTIAIKMSRWRWLKLMLHWGLPEHLENGLSTIGYDHFYYSYLSHFASDKPKPPQGKVEFLEKSGKCVKMKWKAPKDNGGKEVTHFIIERRIAGKRSWIKIGEIESKHTSFATDKVEEGKAYQFRILAVNSEGVSDPLETEEIFAGDPIGKQHPSLLIHLSVDCIFAGRNIPLGCIDWGERNHIGLLHITGCLDRHNPLKYRASKLPNLQNPNWHIIYLFIYYIIFASRLFSMNTMGPKVANMGSI